MYANLSSIVEVKSLRNNSRGRRMRVFYAPPLEYYDRLPLENTPEN